MNKFWKFTNAVESSESTLILDGPIASESWWGDEVTPQAFREELAKQSGRPLTVILNSPGGDVFAGLSIYNALREYNADVTIRVDGLAASIASIIAMAGNKIIMSPGTMMMIHKPSSLVIGNADDMEKEKQILLNIEESMIPIYADRTGLSTDEIASMMDAETWMSADKAVELGFADEVAESVKRVEQPEPIQNTFGGFAFSMSATKSSLASLYSKVTDSVEQVEDVIEDIEVVEQTADVAEIIETTETNEELEVKINEQTDEVKEINEMEQEIAKSQVIAPSALAGVEVKASADYLKTKGAISDFANILVGQAGKEAKDVKAAWGQHLVTMGISNPEILLPTALISSIEDAFKEGGEIWSLVSKTGLTVFRNAIDTVTGETSRAKGHTRGADKGEQVITLGDRTIRAQFIYKYITLNKEDIRENRDTAALVTYVLTELPRRIVREIERAIVIGDGRVAEDEFKIDSFMSISEDAIAATGYAQVYTPEVGESKYESLLKARDLITADGEVYIIAKKGFLTNLLLEVGVNGGYIFAPGTDVVSALGFAGKVEPDWFTDATDTEHDAYLFVPSAYKTVGDNSIEAYTNFVLKSNKQEYLQEIYAGGALMSANSAVAIANIVLS